MAILVPLPAYSALPKVVIFHREHPSEPLIVMQVPTGDSEEFETYRVRLDHKEHKEWMRHLPNARNLAYQLTCESHLVYFPHNEGTVLPLDDAEELPILRAAMQKMRSAPDPNRTDRMFAKRRRVVPGVSKLRLALAGNKRGGR
ncbi:MAG TPA: hypothetical protein VMW52_00025 [Phycisphaerae bacterium]|nr:hypothetical protein [Phycisphaerae bacterium]